jgi:hypothetical protein
MRSILFALLMIPAVASANALPACWPAEAAGTGSPIVVRAGIAGLAYGWHCPQQRQIQTVAGPWAAFLPNFEAEGRKLAAGTDAERQAAWAKHVTRTAPLSAGVAVLRDAVAADVKARYVK